jgi:hypothetical protein
LPWASKASSLEGPAVEKGDFRLKEAASKLDNAGIERLRARNAKKARKKH